MQGYPPATRTAPKPPHRPAARRTGAGEEALALLAFLAMATATLWATTVPLFALATLGATPLAAYAARKVTALARQHRLAARRSRA